MEKRTNDGEQPIWQIWISSNYPVDNAKMLLQIDNEATYNTLVDQIGKMIEDAQENTDEKEYSTTEKE